MKKKNRPHHGREKKKGATHRGKEGRREETFPSQKGGHERVEGGLKPICKNREGNSASEQSGTVQRKKKNRSALSYLRW